MKNLIKMKFPLLIIQKTRYAANPLKMMKQVIINYLK